MHGTPGTARTQSVRRVIFPYTPSGTRGMQRKSSTASRELIRTNAQETPALAGDPLAPLRDPWSYPFWAGYSLFLGACQVFQGNMALIAAANGMSISEAQLIVWISLLMNCVGRISVGAASDWLQQRARPLLHRTLLVAALAAVACALLALLCVDALHARMVWPACLLANFCLGGSMVVGSAYVSERHGVAFFGLNVGALTLTCSLVCLALSEAVGLVYDRHAGADHRCVGTECFQLGFAQQLAAVALAVLLLGAVYVHEVQRAREVQYQCSSTLADSP
eukprot:TRINITY_DN637_c0_g2_i1.p2 TRINITY_DN637_c0_g2~~TRINITY_DN637_c0_g2_i1.p2  ORF type:complete len:279 (-),score=70.53 TRINITY_DN637_c0_g2_i1:103-939(-)